ncbi:uncharacterized protein LOC128557092 [Mercenaria mercenaria]|uniref:uncharacterized protein LOC128557092 n=1 Tax=Mercenaria mercenaria TaxID=6596 RepID=UPI00234E568B|nr:uncharacterized protein LOC128557092 [Mercenaria mercenaria]
MKNIIGSGQSYLNSDMCTKEVSTADSLEIKSGRLCLVQQHKGRKLKVQVFVRVYRSSFEHYAVLFKDQKFSLQSGYISLKNCIVDKTNEKEHQVRVTLNDYEGTGVTFESNSCKEAEEWHDALQPQILSSSPTLSAISPSLSPVIPRSPLMPTLAEEEESDDDV